VDLCPEELEGVVIHRVPGNFHPGLINKSLKKIVDCNLAGKRFRLIHDLQQLDNHAGCDFILFGHTHASFCEEMKGRIYLNPGHLKKEEDRGHQASYGILTLTEEMMIYENKRYDGRLIYSRSWRSNRS
jgi:predicted phosphodiesterase